MTLLTGCQRHATPPSLRRSVSETSLSQPGSQEEELKRHYSTLPETMRGLETSPGESPAPAPAEERTGGSMRYSLYQSPHLLLLQGYSQQHVSTPPSFPLPHQALPFSPRPSCSPCSLGPSGSVGAWILGWIASHLPLSCSPDLCLEGGLPWEENVGGNVDTSCW